MPGLFKRRYKGYRKRRGGKRGRYGSKRRSRAGFARKVLNIVRNGDNTPQTVTSNWFIGYTGGLQATPTAPSPSRTIAFGRVNWKNPLFMQTLMALNDRYNDLGGMNPQEKIWVHKYFEKHTIQNASLFPCVVTVYEFYNPALVTNFSAWNPAVPGGFAQESGFYNTAMSAENTLGTIGNTYTWPIALLMKYNYFEGKEFPGATSGGSDANRSFVDISNFGPSTYINPVFNRAAHMIQFKTRNMGTEIVFKKKKIVTLGPGQQFSYMYVKKNKWLDFYGGATPSESVYQRLGKGAGGVVFHAIGLMSHDTATTGGTLQAVRRSSFILNQEVKMFVRFNIVQQATVQQFNSKEQTYIGNGGISNEVRSGLAVTEVAPT